MTRTQNFDFIQDTLSVFLFLERATRRMIFQKMCKAISMQEEREKGQKNNAKRLLLPCNNIAFRF
mgnify:CR=1 FL=1